MKMLSALGDITQLGLSPDRVERVLHRLDVARIVDTREQGWRFKAAAWWEESTATCTAVHVTDDPSRILHKLRAGQDPDVDEHPDKRRQELGPGLYVSAAPQLWMGRARNKWAFLERLTQPQVDKLVDAIELDLNAKLAQRYISTSEAATAFKDVAQTQEDPDWVRNLVARVANQPYNINVSAPHFLASLGIEPATQPREFEVAFAGRFAEMKYGAFTHRATYGILRGIGLDGAFVPSSFAGMPQTVLWTHSSVLRFGDWTRP